jgi:hypothetical protein
VAFSGEWVQTHRANGLIRVICAGGGAPDPEKGGNDPASAALATMEKLARQSACISWGSDHLDKQTRTRKRTMGWLNDQLHTTKMRAYLVFATDREIFFVSWRMCQGPFIAVNDGDG